MLVERQSDRRSARGQARAKFRAGTTPRSEAIDAWISTGDRDLAGGPGPSSGPSACSVAATIPETTSPRPQQAPAVNPANAVMTKTFATARDECETWRHASVSLSYRKSDSKGG